MNKTLKKFTTNWSQSALALALAFALARTVVAAESNPLGLGGREKALIDALQPTLYKALSYPEAFLKERRTLDYREYYEEAILPRLRNISKHIDPKAVRWLDLNGNGTPELLFWTEGLAPSAWGAKEKIFVLQVGSKRTKGTVQVGEDHLKIIASKDIEPSIRGNDKTWYVGSSFEQFERKDGSFGALFSFTQIGASGSSHANIEIAHDKKGKVQLNQIDSSFPIAISEKVHMPTASEEEIAKGQAIIKAMGVEIADKFNLKRDIGFPLRLHEVVEANAIHWLDMDWDSVDELVFWTKGFEPKPWGGKDLIVVVQVASDPTLLTNKKATRVGNQHASVLYVYRFEAFGYKQLSFYPLPMKEKGHNDFLRGVLTFTEEGKKNKNNLYHVIELTYNKYKKRIEFVQFKTSFPAGLR